MPSRRLGRSLGIDLTPHKVCDFDCVYCQCGATTLKTLRRRAYVPYRLIIGQVRRAIHEPGRIDYLTLSGSGEPTLNSNIGRLITELKRITKIPVCVITNGSTMYRPAVRRALRGADLVMPTLCAATQKVFSRVNRPRPELRIREIIRGLAAFRREFRGQIWLEIMLVRDLNDAPRDIRKLKEAVKLIKPDRIQLNTVVRPPSEREARPVPMTVLRKIRRSFGPRCEIIARFNKGSGTARGAGLGRSVMGIIRRRPETAAAIAASLGVNRTEVIKVLQGLVGQRRARPVTHQKKTYYEPA